MSAETPSGLDAQLLDDFFAEADEHLMGIRQALVHLEASVGRAQPDDKVVDELFRCCHSFKGISAIVGLGPAEAVAHATEDVLRVMRGGKAQLTNAGLELLTSSAQKLEQIVAAFRSHKPMPGFESLLARLKQLCEQSSPPGVVSTSTSSQPWASDRALMASLEEAKARGLLLWKYTFSPSRELDARGVNVNSIREQLSQAGDILKATPIVSGPDAINFEFLVAAKETPVDIAAWEAQGVAIHPVEVDEPAFSPLDSPAPISQDWEHNPFLAPSHVVRVDLKRLDDLMRITGEMVIHRSRLDAQLSRLNGGRGGVDLRGVHEVSGGLARSLRELREAIMRVRLVPVGEVFARMPFVVRDLSQQTQKNVRLKLTGQDTAIDKYLIEKLKDPLLHLVRNAFSHGVESPEERTKASKPQEATIELKASAVSDSVLIEVSDDGRGINANAIMQRATSLGIEIPVTVDSQSILQILCSPGFSIREDADRASGRGVGLSVVHSAVRELGGNLTLETEEGRGTRFTLRLPLTLAIAEALIINAAGQVCAVPQSYVREILHATEADIQIVNGIEAIPYRTGILPVIRLAGLFKLPQGGPEKMCLLVISSDRGSVGLLADKVLGQREVVVSALRDPLIQVKGIIGATELGDGKPVLILDGAALTSGSVSPRERGGSGSDMTRFATQA